MSRKGFLQQFRLF